MCDSPGVFPLREVNEKAPELNIQLNREIFILNSLKEKSNDLELKLKRKYSGFGVANSEFNNDELRGMQDLFKNSLDQIALQNVRVTDAVVAINTSKEKILLFLNSTEEDSKKLGVLVEDIGTIKYESDELVALSKNIRELSQKILKEEWERVNTVS
ncbi:hypothetical protein ABMA79_09605 [Halobacteriovorax sp. HFRX-2_2]|uniref:hypothetical protein n=1 Tax=unclassified Halobacteriovorax TaxID=2639665 RepID=UPI00371FDD13